MKNTNNFKKLLLAIFCAGVSGFGVAGTLFTFDDPYLMVMKSNGSMFGYYGATNDRFSCLIFFENSGRNSTISKDNGFDRIPIVAFTFDYQKSNFEYARRDTKFDISGTLYTRQKEWILQTSSMPPGCANVTGSFLNGPEARGAQRFFISRSFSAIGIRVATKKTFFYHKRGNTFSKRREFLVTGDVVAVLEQNGGYSHIRFTNPSSMTSDPGKVATGWVRTSELEDPFPPSGAMTLIR